MKRRTFLCASAAMAFSSAALAKRLARPLQEIADETPYLDTIGLQLHTVRNELAMDQRTTLSAISEAGYKQVELMTTMDADETVKISRDLGLGVNSAFFNWKTIVAPDEPDIPTMESVIEKAVELELEYLVFGYIGKGYRETVEKFKQYADVAGVAGEKCSKAGIQLCYHNHSFEFKPLEEDVCGMDVFLERFHQEFVKFELDIFWAELGGWNPVKTLNKMDGRVAQVHLKDVKKNVPKQFDETRVPEAAFQEIGSGKLKLYKVLNACLDVGVEQCHIEQDYSSAPLRSIVTSYQQFTKLKEEEKAEQKAKEAKGANNPFG